MMIEEFEQRTGYFPSSAEYKAIEAAYMEFDGDKDEFCKAYKKNANGIAERIRREVNAAAFKESRQHTADLTRRDIEIERLKKQLEREQEWKPYEDADAVSQFKFDTSLLCRASFPAELEEDGGRCIVEVTVYRLNAVAVHTFLMDGPEPLLRHLGLSEADTYITKHDIDDLVTVVRIIREEAPAWQH